MRNTVGLDISKNTIDATALIGGSTAYKQFQNHEKGHHELKDWIQQQNGESVHICMEATGTYYEDAAAFLSTHHTVCQSPENQQVRRKQTEPHQNRQTRFTPDCRLPAITQRRRTQSLSSPKRTQRQTQTADRLLQPAPNRTHRTQKPTFRRQRRNRQSNNRSNHRLSR